MSAANDNANPNRPLGSFACHNPAEVVAMVVVFIWAARWLLGWALGVDA